MPGPEDFDFDALSTETEIDRRVRFGVLSLELSELCMVMQTEVRDMNGAADSLEALLASIEAKNGVPPTI